MLKRTLVPPQYASVRREAVAQIIRECRAMQSTSKDDIFRRGRTRIPLYMYFFSISTVNNPPARAPGRQIHSP
jgi:hypothetical protein